MRFVRYGEGSERARRAGIYRCRQSRGRIGGPFQKLLNVIVPATKARSLVDALAITPALEHGQDLTPGGLTARSQRLADVAGSAPRGHPGHDRRGLQGRVGRAERFGAPSGTRGRGTAQHPGMLTFVSLCYTVNGAELVLHKVANGGVFALTGIGFFFGLRVAQPSK